MIIGAIAGQRAVGTLGPMAKVALIGESANVVPISMTFADVAGAILTGIGGARILSNEIERKQCLRQRITSRSSLIRERKIMATEADVRALLDQVKSGSTFEALRASEQLAKIGRNRRKSTDELLREAVEAGAEAVRDQKELDVDEIVRNVKQRAGWPQ